LRYIIIITSIISAIIKSAKSAKLQRQISDKNMQIRWINLSNPGIIAHIIEYFGKEELEIELFQ